MPPPNSLSFNLKDREEKTEPVELNFYYITGAS
jgi:hypothetical protein